MYFFSPLVDPERPIDPSDPPPKQWQDIDGGDYQSARKGFPPSRFVACRQWERRELERARKRGVIEVE